jgi:hypothetical protein
MSWITDLLFGGSDQPAVQNTANSNSSTEVTVNPEVTVLNDFTGLQGMLAQLNGAQVATAAAGLEQAKALRDTGTLIASVGAAAVAIWAIRKAK